MKTPAWVMDYAAQMQEVLGLGAWALTFEMCEQTNPENPAADATTYANPRYLEALIKLRPCHFRRPSNGGKVLIIHELLHVVDSERDRVTHQLLDVHVPAGARAIVDEMMADANERRVVKLSRALFYALEPKPDA